MHSVALISFTASLLAGFIQGFSGFGSVLVALPILLTALPARVAVPLVSLVALTINAVMVSRLRGHMRKEPIRILLACSIPGMAAGAWLLDGIPDAFIKGLLGAVILYVVLNSFFSRGLRQAPHRAWTYVAGFASGAIGILIGANGPPVIAWAARQPWGRDELKATLTFYFLLSGFLIVGTQALKGLVTGQVGTLFAWSLPGLLAGLWLGFAACGRAGDRVFRTVVMSLLGITGAGLVWQAAVALAGR